MLEMAHCGKQTKLLGKNQQQLNICGYKAISDSGEKIGSIHDYVFDETGRIRFLVVDSGFWIFGKKVLVPVGMANILDDTSEVMLRGLTRSQVEALPHFDESKPISERYESELMKCYYPQAKTESIQEKRGEFYDKNKDFTTPERIRLVEEHLHVDKHAEKIGDVRIRKQVETHQETIEVPVSRERVIIEGHPSNVEFVGDVRDFEQESIEIPLYREEVDVTKHPVISEEVTIRKEKQTQTRKVSESVRQEKLEIEKGTGVELTDVDEERGINKKRP